MLMIKIIDTLTHFITEFLYMLACALYYAWQYRAIIVTFILLFTLAMLGVIGYGMKTNGMLY